MTIFFETPQVQLHQGDCLSVMPTLEAGSFDAIICDLPYGTTACSWDAVIPFEPLWECYKRLIKPNGAIVLFASQPFTSELVMSNRKWFKYEWIWRKELGSNFGAAKYQPLKAHENIVVFSKTTHTYQPQMRFVGHYKNHGDSKKRNKSLNFQTVLNRADRKSPDRFPESVLDFESQGMECNNLNRVHPTQKPVPLLQYLLRTYTRPGDRILDNTAGSFTTGVAAVLTGRQFTGIELLPEYCEIGQKRIELAIQEVDSMLIKPWEMETVQPVQNVQMSLLEEETA